MKSSRLRCLIVAALLAAATWGGIAVSAHRTVLLPREALKGVFLLATLGAIPLGFALRNHERPAWYAVFGLFIGVIFGGGLGTPVIATRHPERHLAPHTLGAAATSLTCGLLGLGAGLYCVGPSRHRPDEEEGPDEAKADGVG